MFDFAKWCGWTETEGERLKSIGFKVTFKAMDLPLEKAGLEVIGGKAAAVLQFWGDHSGRGHGLADIDLMDVDTKVVTLVCVATKVTDLTFPNVFQKFLGAIGNE